MSNKCIKVCHVSSVHVRTDTRVAVRECGSLARNGYNVTLVIEGENEDKNGIHFVGVGKQPESRLKRMIKFAPKTYRTAKTIDADIFHFHDPEMIPYALKLKKDGKKVVYDIHENIAATIIDKDWVPSLIRKPLAYFFDLYEQKQVKKFDGIIVVTKGLAQKYKKNAQRIEVVNNYPDLTDIEHHSTPFEMRERIIGYAGNMSALYGEKVIYEAMKGIDATLILAGGYAKEETGNIKVRGRIDRAQVNALYGKSRLGFVLYQPAGNNNESQPAKMFEYMAAGLPIVASNFPLWKEIIEKNKCGICVNPGSSDEVRDAINYLLDNPSEAQEMGERGYKIVSETMNWSNEFKKIEKLYWEIMNTKHES